MSPSHSIAVKRALVLVLVIISLGTIEAQASMAPQGVGLTTKEKQRRNELLNRLCSEKEVGCDYLTSIFRDPRLEIYQPPQPTAEQAPSSPQRERERNPYLTNRFGLVSTESLERCRSFIGAHAATLAAAYEEYGVSKEIICGHLRIETDFGIPTKLSPNPLGTRPAINQLISLYVRNPSLKDQGTRFVRRQEFAFAELSKLIAAGKKFGWDLFGVPGSPTGAIGLVQFEPSSFSVAVDGNGDGRIDLFDPDDAILSIAHYLVTRGWDRDPEHQRRAIYAYYGGHYDQDPHKYYMEAVLRYANEVHTYLRNHPVERDYSILRGQLIASPARRLTVRHVVDGAVEKPHTATWIQLPHAARESDRPSDSFKFLEGKSEISSDACIACSCVFLPSVSAIE
jgi:membrane-bound lytic murein transglycosylase B